MFVLEPYFYLLPFNFFTFLPLNILFTFT